MASKALARATCAAGSAWERATRINQSRSSSVSGRSGSFWRRVIGKPPERVARFAAYSAFTKIATPMTNDPLVLWGEYGSFKVLGQRSRTIPPPMGSSDPEHHIGAGHNYHFCYRPL